MAMVARPRNASLAALALFLGLAASPAGAADLYWDADGVTSPTLGGTGTWNTTGLNWSTNNDGIGGPFFTWNNAAGDNAIFDGTAGTVTLGAPITAGGLTFSVGGYTIAGSTLTLGGATPTITATGSATISSIVAGSAGLTKAGAGTLTLSGANTFTGAINLNAGGIAAASDAALGNANNAIFTAAGTSVSLQIAGADTNRAVNIGDGGTLTLSGSGAGSALITGNGRVSVGNGVTMSNDASTYTGRTTFSGVNGVASSYFTSIGNLGEASSLGAPTTVEDGTIVFNQSSQYSDNVIYLGDGDSSNRNWDLNGAAALIRNRGTGTLSITGDVDTSSGSGFVAEGADIELLGVLSGGNYSFSGNAGRTITLGEGNTYTGASSIGTVTLTVSTLADRGTASSLGTNDNTGTAPADIQINNGVLDYTGDGDSSNRTWQISNNSSLLNNGTGALALTGAVTFNPAASIDTLNLGGGFTGESTISGGLTGSGRVVMDGSGTWVLSGANSFTGGVTVQSGTLRAGSASAFGTAGLIVNGGTLDLNGFGMTTATLEGTGGTVALGSANLTLNATSGSKTFAGAITGSGGLTKLGASTLTLTGANTYTGTTSIGGGTLALNFTAAGAPASNIISASSALTMGGGTLSIMGGTGTNGQSFNGLTITAGNNRINATTGAGGALTVDLGAIARTSGLADFGIASGTSMATSNADGALGGWATVNGTDYAQVSGGFITAFTNYVNQDDAGLWATGNIVSDEGGNPNTPYFGTVNGNVALGGLKYTAAANSAVTVGTGNTLGVDGTILVSPSVATANQTIQGGSLTGGAGASALGVQQNGGGTFTIASTIVDNGGATSFTVGGTGTGSVSLTSTNSYTGATTVSGSTLVINSVADGGAPSAIGASSNDPSNLVLENGTLRYTGGTAPTDRGFTLVNGGPSRTIQVDGTADLTFSGQVTSPDDAGFTKTGTGTLTLTNASNDYVGVTTIAGGTLAVTTLADGGSPSSIGAASNDSSNLVLQGGGELEYRGGTSTSNRGFTLGTGGGGIDVAEDAATLTMSGVATGAGSLTKNGAGTLVLSGTNTYTGATTVSAGTLQAGSTSAFGTGAMTVNTGATLDLANNANTVRGLNGTGSVLLGTATLTTNGNGSFSGTISGTGGVTVASGTQTFSGCTNSYGGATTITGTLSVSCLRNGLQSSDIGASSKDSANLNLAGGILLYTGGNVTTDRGFTLTGTGTINVSNAATTLEFAGVVTGTSLSKIGSGTLVLSGANTYGAGGATLVNGGTVRAGSTQAFGVSGLRMDTTGATLDLDDFDNTVAYINQANLDITGGSITLGSATLTLSGAANTNYNGAISGTGGLVKNGNGTQTLSGTASSYTGSTVINGGILAVASLTNGNSNSSIGASASDASNLILDGGTLQYNGTGDSTDRQFTLGSNGGSLDASGTGAIDFTSTAPVTLTDAGNRTLTLTGTSTADNTLSARIDDPSSGTTSLTKTGDGTWVLANAESTYTGVTTISGGVLAVDKLADGGEASSIGMSSNAATSLVIGSGSTLRYTGAGDTTDRLFTLQTGVSFIESSGTGAIVFSNTGSALYTGNGNRTLALGGTNTDNNIMGGTIVDGPGGVTLLAKNGTGTWVLTGNNSYTGNTVVNDGNLIIGNGGTTGNAGVGNVIVNAASSTLSFNRSDNFNFAGTLSGPGSIAQIGTGTTVLTSTSNTIGASRVDAGVLQVDGGLTTGAATVNAGVLAVSAGGTLTTPAIAMNAGSTLTVGGTADATGGAQAVITGDAGASTITVDAGGILRATGNLGNGSDVVTLAGTLDTGAAALSLGDGDDRLALNDGGAIGGAGVLGGAGIDTLQVNNAVARALDAASVGGFEALDKTLAGTLTLTGDHVYTAGTTIAAGTVQVGDGGISGSLAGDVSNNGTLAFNRSDALTFVDRITGGGNLQQIGAGTTTLTGDSSTFTGATSITGGALLVNGMLGDATSTMDVMTGGTLGGTGTLGGNVTVADGGTITPGTAGTVGALTINGNLTLGANSTLAYDFGRAGFVGGALNDLMTVHGDVALGGTLNVMQSPGGTFGPGVYRVIDYDGNLTGSLGVSGPGLAIQTAANQVNLVNTAGLTLNFWDGDAGPKNNDAVNGGDGTWRASGDDNWTDENGQVNGAFTPNGFAIFQGTPGTVTVDAAGVGASGMQFGVHGYTVQGGTITLAPDANGQSMIRVGLGSVGADYVATVDATLTGGTELVKTDPGTLVLTGANSYTGGTAINGGTLQVSSNANLGAAAGALALDSGTLHSTGSFTSARAVTLENGGGAFSTDTSTTLTLTSPVTGAGALIKDGAGTLVLAADNGYLGGTVIDAGTLQVGNGGATGTITGDVANDGTLAFNRTGALSYAGVIAGTGQLQVSGGLALTMTGDSNYSGNTTINGGSGLTLSGGGSIVGTASTTLNDNSTLTVSGAGSELSTGTLRVGEAAGSTSTVAIDNGGVVKVGGDANFGGVPLEADAATLTLNGAGSSLQVGGALRLGTRSQAALDANIADGARIESNSAQIGAPFTSLGDKKVTLSGAGTSWTNTTSLNIRSGTLSVLDGAQLSTGSFDMTAATVPAALIVSGANAIFSSAGDLAVRGAGTSSTVTLADDGELRVGGQLALGASAVLNIGGGEGQPAAAAGTLDAPTLTFAAPGTGRVNFNHTETDYGFATAMSGAGAINQAAGVTRLIGDSSGFTGATAVSGGTLLVDNTLGDATSTVGVATGGTLGGVGTVGGNVTVANGAISPGDLGATPQTLTINGSLALSGASALNYNFGEAGIVGGMLNDHLVVGGGLTLDGTINVTQSAGGTFGPGVYRVISYNGAFTDNGLAIDTMPAGSSVTVQSSIANQVNLVNAAGLTLNFWDGDAGPKNNNAINGGDGTWRASGDDNWTDQDGIANGAFAPNGFAIFQGTPGTVTVDTGGVSASGMQFAVDGYRVEGGPITLVSDGASGQSVIRVGVGSVGADYVATIASDLSGATQLVKDDLGTLVLSGTNSYTGGTLIRNGTLSISADANLGDAAGGLTFDGGTLATTADVTSARNVTLAGAGTILTDTLTTTTLNGSVTGTGSLTKGGGGTLVLAGTGNSAGGTNVDAGLLQVDSDLTTPTLGLPGSAALTVNGTVEAAGAAPVVVTGDAGASTITVNGTLRANGDLGGGSDVLTLAGTLDTAGLALTLGDDDDRLTLSDGAAITGTGIDGSAGTDALVADNAAAMTLAAASVTGFESLTKQNTGVLTLVGDHSYANGTTIAAGTLQLGDGSSAASLTGDVVNNGTLAFNLPGSYSFAGLITGTGGLDQIGPGTTTLTANNSYAGPTTVSAGTLLVNGDQSGATALTTVATGGTLGGTGVIGGGVTVADGAINPGQPNAVGTLAINGGLALGTGSVLNYDFGQANVPGGALNDLLTVGGDLTLDGTLNVAQTAGGSFGPGLYRIISYSGTLTDNGLQLGTLPAGAQATVQTSIANQINLVNSGGLPLSYWDGDLGPKNDGAINGGDGIWRATGDDNWTDVNGAANAPYSNGSFAIFAGKAGAVSVDTTNGEVRASGMQFATDGYTVQGGSITLVPSSGTQAIVRVGDGTADGAGYTATIAAALTGSAGLAKTDAGTLALTGTSSYTGATDVVGGTLAVDGAIAGSAVTVHQGARLAGNGTVGGLTVAAGGTIAPGHSIGTLQVAGTYTQASGATYQVEVDPTS
ncbi:autotransporter-associated beta strand repeat-containing protein, partial [Chelatococcus sp. GCM10030263]|uniref:autotransporter-associated beta strand repeat-containing protein n=1 Tax=Chelatococcus sp. GCM10030263 TaxID=3273387 RepID=UPI00361665ED